MQPGMGCVQEPSLYVAVGLKLPERLSVQPPLEAAAVVDERKRPVVRAVGSVQPMGGGGSGGGGEGGGQLGTGGEIGTFGTSGEGGGLGGLGGEGGGGLGGLGGGRRRRRLRGDAQGHVAAAFEVALRRPAIIPTLGEFCAEPIVSLIERGAVRVPVAIAYRRDRDEYSGRRRPELPHFWHV